MTDWINWRRSQRRMKIYSFGLQRPSRTTALWTGRLRIWRGIAWWRGFQRFRARLRGTFTTSKEIKRLRFRLQKVLRGQWLPRVFGSHRRSQRWMKKQFASSMIQCLLGRRILRILNVELQASARLESLGWQRSRYMPIQLGQSSSSQQWMRIESPEQLSMLEGLERRYIRPRWMRWFWEHKQHSSASEDLASNRDHPQTQG